MSSESLKNDRLVSVIIPCYNYGRFLSESIQSVIDQTYQNWECLVINDGSLDNTEEIALEYCKRDSRVHYFFQKNKGTSEAKNLGLLKAKGDYIQFLDADDLLPSLKIEKQVQYLTNNPAIDLVCTKSLFFNDNAPENLFESYDLTEKNIVERVRFSKNRIKNLELFFIKNQFTISSALLKRPAVSKYNKQLRFGEDWEFWIQLLIAKFNFEYIDDTDTYPLIRIHEQNSTGNRINILYGNLYVKKKVKYLLRKNKGEFSSREYNSLICTISSEIDKTREFYTKYIESLIFTDQCVLDLRHLQLLFKHLLINLRPFYLIKNYTYWLIKG